MLIAPDENSFIREHKSKIYEFYFMVRLWNKIFDEDMTILAKKVNLSFPQFLTLMIVNHGDGLMVSEIARIGHWHVSTVMSLLSHLKEKGLVELVPVEKGKGSYVLPTELGRKTFTQKVDAPPEKIKKIVQTIGIDMLKKSMDFHYSILEKVIGKDAIRELRQYLNKATCQIEQTKL